MRARIDLISEMPGAWRLLVRRWSRQNRSKKRLQDGTPAPSRNDEYLLYQTLLGSLPTEDMDDAALAAYRERIKAYAIKAAREAKVGTSWINVNADYEAALTGFVEGLLAAGERNLFLDDLRSQRAFFSWFGMLNSVAMTALKMTSPGVPDIYQGNELLDFSLVDPDNRRAVDYDARRAALASLRHMAEAQQADLASAVRALFARHEDGRAKLWVVWRALQLRARHTALFRDGGYTALAVEGERARHAIAFARHHEGEQCVVVSGRLFASLGLEAGALPVGEAVWRDTTVVLAGDSPSRYRDVLTGRAIDVRNGRLAVRDVLTDFPVALLVDARGDAFG